MMLKSISLTSALVFSAVLPGFSASETPSNLLKNAQHFADLYNWRVASPLFQQAEALLRQKDDERNALYAQIGVLRLTSNAPINERSDEIAQLLSTNTLVAHDKQLRLFALKGVSAKGVAVSAIDSPAPGVPWKSAGVTWSITELLAYFATRDTQALSSTGRTRF